MDVGEKGGGDVDPVITVWDVVVVVAETVGEVFVDPLECVVVCGSNVGRREITRDYWSGGDRVDGGDGLFDGGQGESWGNGYGGVGRAGDVCGWVHGDQWARRVDVGVGVGGVMIHRIRRVGCGSFGQM